jgi:DNA mismatch repair ATPase MutS
MLLPEDASDMLDAVAELNRTINALSQLSGGLNKNPDLTALLGKIVAGQAAILDLLKTKKDVRQWEFDMFRHPNGDLEKVRATAL